MSDGIWEELSDSLPDKEEQPLSVTLCAALTSDRSSIAEERNRCEAHRCLRPLNSQNVPRKVPKRDLFLAGVECDRDARSLYSNRGINDLFGETPDNLSFDVC